ncbi:Lactamase_B domain-containing protein [Rubrivivax sp. A210]|uniref:MBL fold metallo-hydrolase n=1 Tax=Rubrivivax sp. A210 TaxID=2772301 RepID=UPI001918A6AD|nr:MBL fold metallo-hydrolase [Rubrivivax sp. A210]CAD5370219.1 Lactamase_B domain-containing protein [Rubrivivax sp. A210]
MTHQPTPRRQALLALLALAATPALAQTDFSKVEIKAEKLSDTTWMLTGAGGNLGLSAGDDAVFLIDDQFAPMAPKIQAAIAQITKRPLQFVLNTHFHFDHTGGNEALGSKGALIVAHDNVRRRMSSDQLINFVGSSNKQPASPKVALPVVTVAGEISFHINGDEVYAFHVPRAHTDGDLIVHFRKSDVVHMGDVYFNGMYPFIDGSSGGTADGVLAAADRVLKLAGDKTRIIPGHGPLASKADLVDWRDMLATVIVRIKDLRLAGKSDAEIRAAGVTAEYDARYGNGFVKPEAFVQMMLGVLPPK